MKRLIAVYGLLVIAALFSFLFALNLRVIIMAVYRVYSRDPLQLAGSIINAVTVILAMILWIIYFFYLQHRLEKKCLDFRQFLRTFLIFILPAFLFYAVSEFIIRLP